MSLSPMPVIEVEHLTLEYQLGTLASLEASSAIRR